VKLTFLLVVTFAVVLVAIPRAPASAANFPVTNLNDSGAGSLREAIANANALAGADTITFTGAAVAGVISPTTQLPSIMEDLTITGPGAAALAIDGSLCATCTAFHVGSNAASFTLIGVTVRNWPANGIRHQGFILTVQNSVISNNTAAAVSQAPGAGGGILAVTGSVNIVDSTIANNNAIEGGGVAAVANQFAQLMSVRTERSTIRDNQATTGAGIKGTGGASIILFDTTVSGNSATGAGGGIHQEGAQQPLGVQLHNSTLSGNTAGGAGGGAWANGFMRAFSSTIYGNSSTNGALFHSASPATSSLVVNTIVANNQGGNCGTGPGTVALASSGSNISSDATCNFNQPGDQVNTNPLLGPLANNGGPTLTHLPLPGSPAIDTGRLAVPPDGMCFASTAADQRGFPRPTDGDGDGTPECDIGAVEVAAVSPVPSPTPVPGASPTPSPTVLATSPLATATPLTPARQPIPQQVQNPAAVLAVQGVAGAGSRNATPVTGAAPASRPGVAPVITPPSTGEAGLAGTASAHLIWE
jgi:hypothetical protein